MKNLNVGSKVMISLEYYIKQAGGVVIPPFGTVIDLNGRIVTVMDCYGHTWNLDGIFVEEDVIKTPEVKYGDSFNSKIVKNFVQLFQNEDDVIVIDEKVTKYFESKLSPYDFALGKVIDLSRAIEKYREFSKDLKSEKEIDDKVEYLYSLVADLSRKLLEEKEEEEEISNSQAAPEKDGKVNPLDYLTDMTKIARKTPYDKAYGRDAEINQVMRTVMHRDKKNAILVGKQGCGKTTIMEELANRIASGEIPALRGKKILAMDVDGMIAGTKYRGMFEERCKAVLSYCAKEKDAIIFIDEVHKIMGAGGNTEGGMNLGNLMKTYLTKGISVIGATTYDEYNNLKRDAALSRRFGIIPIKEQEPEMVKWIMQKVKEDYESYHHVKISDTLIEAIVDTFDQKNYNTSSIDYARGALDSICTIMSLEGARQSEAYAEFMRGQDYDKEENNSYVKKGAIGFLSAASEETKDDKSVKNLRPDVMAFVEVLKEEEAAEDERLERAMNAMILEDGDKISIQYPNLDGEEEQEA